VVHADSRRIAYGNGAGVSYGLLIDSGGHLHALYDGTGVTYAYLTVALGALRPLHLDLAARSLGAGWKSSC